jgi:L-ascorbate metabolism protein UlaG (beta-lactamase superfamily)
MYDPEVSLTLIGGPTVLLEIGGFRVLTDPTFDPPSKYEAGGIVLEKTAGPALTVDEVAQSTSPWSVTISTSIIWIGPAAYS